MTSVLFIPSELLAWRGYPGSMAQMLGSEMERGKSEEDGPGCSTCTL